MKIKTVRRGTVTVGADPTTMVIWRADCENGEQITVTEFQNVYKGGVTYADGKFVEFSEGVAQLMHESLERSHELQQELDDLTDSSDEIDWGGDDEGGS